MGLLVALVPTSAQARPVPEAPSKAFALVVHVATKQPVEEVEERIVGLLAAANASFAPAGIAFHVLEVRALPDRHAVLKRRLQRRRLRRYLVPRAINIFLVDRIHERRATFRTRRAARWVGRQLTDQLSGAHVRVMGEVPDGYIILSRSAEPHTAAHELGHFFGAPHHRDPANIMSYGGERVGFSRSQLKGFKRRAREYKRKRDLNTVRSLFRFRKRNNPG